MSMDSDLSPHRQSQEVYSQYRLTELGKTPIKVERLRHFLKSFPNKIDAHILLDGFTNGFKVNYMGPRQAVNCSNLISAKQHESELEEKITKEIQAGRIAGPFKNKPFSNLRLSPIGLVAKKPPPGSKIHGWRMIQHLSYPLGSSINSFIDPQLATVQYTSFDKVLGTISKLGKGAEMARMDIVSAFRLLILHPDEFVLFGFRFQDNFYFQKALPMGCSAACALFDKFSCFLEWLVRFQSHKESIEHYLDDFLLAGEARSGECLHLMNNFRTICSDIGVPLAEEKTLGPSCIMTFLGLEIDTLEMVIRIPQDKLTEVKGKLELTIKKRKITLRDLQSLVGSLNFCAKAIPSVRAFNKEVL